MDPSISTAFTAALEGLCNRALAYDPCSQQALRKLCGKVLAIEASAPALTFFITADANGKLALMSHYQGAVTTRIQGQLTHLLSMAFSPESTSLSQRSIQVIGSTGLLVDLQNILKNLDIDWEDALNQHIGDIAGHPIANSLRQAGFFLKQRTQTVKRLSAEYIQEELKLVPSKPELEDYYRQVDELRLASDRAQARLQQLQQRLHTTPPPNSGQSSDQ